jgi:hypothetical protein
MCVTHFHILRSCVAWKHELYLNKQTKKKYTHFNSYPWTIACAPTYTNNCTEFIHNHKSAIHVSAINRHPKGKITIEEYKINTSNLHIWKISNGSNKYKKVMLTYTWRKFTDVSLFIFYVITCTETSIIIVFDLKGLSTQHNTLLHKINPYTVHRLDQKIVQPHIISVQRSQKAGGKSAITKQH